MGAVIRLRWTIEHRYIPIFWPYPSSTIEIRQYRWRWRALLSYYVHICAPQFGICGVTYVTRPRLRPAIEKRREKISALLSSPGRESE